MEVEFLVCAWLSLSEGGLDARLLWTLEVLKFFGFAGLILVGLLLLCSLFVESLYRFGFIFFRLWFLKSIDKERLEKNQTDMGNR